MRNKYECILCIRDTAWSNSDRLDTTLGVWQSCATRMVQTPTRPCHFAVRGPGGGRQSSEVALAEDKLIKPNSKRVQSMPIQNRLEEYIYKRLPSQHPTYPLHQTTDPGFDLCKHTRDASDRLKFQERIGGHPRTRPFGHSRSGRNARHRGHEAFPRKLQAMPSLG